MNIMCQCSTLHVHTCTLMGRTSVTNPLSIVREVIRREGEVGGADWVGLIIDENTKLSSTESSEKNKINKILFKK